jgi:hypothetical protein
MLAWVLLACEAASLSVGLQQQQQGEHTSQGWGYSSVKDCSKHI